MKLKLNPSFGVCCGGEAVFDRLILKLNPSFGGGGCGCDVEFVFE